MSRFRTTLVLIFFTIISGLPSTVNGNEENSNESFFADLPVETHGFYEIRGGYRLQGSRGQRLRPARAGITDAAGPRALLPDRTANPTQVRFRVRRKQRLRTRRKPSLRTLRK